MMDRFNQAIKLGDLALLRLRAETLLDRIDDKERRAVTITDDEREELARIASAPKADDRAFLGKFDSIYEQDEADEGP